MTLKQMKQPNTGMKLEDLAERENEAPSDDRAAEDGKQQQKKWID